MYNDNEIIVSKEYQRKVMENCISDDGFYLMDIREAEDLKHSAHLCKNAVYSTKRNETSSVFTVSYDGIAKQLITQIYLSNGEKRVYARALWDTGASYSCMSSGIEKQLGLEKAGSKLLGGVFSRGKVDGYITDVGLNDFGTIPRQILYATDIGSNFFDVVIGMDIIMMGDFAVTNYNMKTTLTFRIPSKEVIDFID